MLSGLAMSDLAKAREVYGQMSEPNKKHPSTKYLLYKMALRCKDKDLGVPSFYTGGQPVKLTCKAMESLDAVCVGSTEDATLLYACVLEAQRLGDNQQTIVSLQRILDNYGYGAQSGVHLPALLRYLLMSPLWSPLLTPTVALRVFLFTNWRLATHR